MSGQCDRWIPHAVASGDFSDKDFQAQRLSRNCRKRHRAKVRLVGIFLSRSTHALSRVFDSAFDPPSCQPGFSVQYCQMNPAASRLSRADKGLTCLFMRKLLEDWHAAGASCGLFRHARTLNERRQSLENSDTEVHLSRNEDPKIALAPRTTRLYILVHIGTWYVGYVLRKKLKICHFWNGYLASDCIQYSHSKRCAQAW